MKATFLWSCNSFKLSGTKAGPLRAALKAIKQRESSRQLEIDDLVGDAEEDLSLEGAIDENSGLFVDLIVLELGVQGCSVKVEISTGHLLEHDCGQYFLPAAWNSLPSGEVLDQSFVTGKPIILIGKTCTCGRAASFRDLELIHAEDVLNADGGQA